MSTSTHTGTVAFAPASSGESTLIVRPSRIRRNWMTTLADVVDHLLDVEGIRALDTRAIDKAIRATTSALSNFVSYSSSGFKYYDARTTLIANASVTLGEIVVSNGVGTVTAGYTAPSWISYGHVRIGSKSWPVLDSGSGTITLSTNLSDGTYANCVLEQIMVRLPHDFRRRGSITESGNDYPVADVNAGYIQDWEDCFNWNRSSDPGRSFAAVSSDTRFQGEMMLVSWPPVTVRTELSLFYERYPASCKVHRVNNGTVTITGSSVVASAAVFTSDHIGSALVIGTNSSTEMPKSLSSRDLVSGQRIITAVSDSTNATIDSDFTTGDARSYYISDVVDVLIGPQTETFLRLAEYELARQSKDRVAAKVRMSEFRQQLAIAMADDSRYRSSVDSSCGGGSGYWIGDVEPAP